jgi:signal transduction histidine kinase
MVTPLTLLLLENSLAEAQQWLEMLTPNRPAEGGDETAWHVTHVYNADEGLKHLKQTQFDAALLGLADLLMGLNSFKRLELPERFQTYLGLALDEGERLTRLLNQILVYAKPQNLELAELNLNEWLTGLLDSLKTMPAATSRQLFYTPFPKPVKVLADADKLKQVVINLVANAFEAIKPGETVTLAVHTDPSIQPSNHSAQSIPSSVCIRVHNGGDPIPTDVLPKLTQPFVTTKTNVYRCVATPTGALVSES